jgi:hypothetical protein
MVPGPQWARREGGHPADDPRDDDATSEFAFYLLGRVGACTESGKFG